MYFAQYEKPICTDYRSCGFIGSHLCERFLSEGFSVHAMDNLLTGSLANIEHLFHDKQFTFYHHDVSKFVHVPESWIIFCILLLWRRRLTISKCPSKRWRLGHLAPTIFLTLKRKRQGSWSHPLLKFMVTCWSIAVRVLLGKKSHRPKRRLWWSKKISGEAITMALSSLSWIETRIVRIFNTYGPRMRREDGRFCRAFFSQAIRGEELTILGTEVTGHFVMWMIWWKGFIDCYFLITPLLVNLGNPQEISV